MELFITISILVVGLAAFGFLAARFGYDSRDGFDENASQSFTARYA